MANLNGVSANFVNVNSLYGVKKAKGTSNQSKAENSVQEAATAANQRKNPDDILTSMHNYGVQNLITPKIEAMKSNPQMAKRIGEFMANFESEVKKGLEVISQDFPSMDEAKSLEVASKAALKASGL
jgi:predicted component of type VI protein secretion system